MQVQLLSRVLAIFENLEVRGSILFSLLFHGMGKQKWQRYTKELLEPIVRDSSSISEVMRRLDLKFGGGSHAYISLVIRKFDISTGHFQKLAHNKGVYHPRKHWTEKLVISATGRREKAYVLREALIDSGVEYKCFSCGLEGFWNGNPITLEVDHKDGDPLNNQRDNLQFLCPNCHSQKPIVRSDGKVYICGEKRRISKIRPIMRRKINKKAVTNNSCLKCGLPTKTKYCSYKCANQNQPIRVNRRKVQDRPCRERLEELLAEHSYCAVGRMFGVSDNAIRKWLRTPA